MKKILFITMLILVSIWIVNSNFDNQEKIDSEVQYIQLNLISWDYNNLVKFDLERAKDEWISNEAIEIWLELEKLTNEVINLTKNNIKNNKNSKIELTDSYKDIKFDKYKKINSFFKKTKLWKNTSSTLATNKALNFDATEICWSFWNPKPTKWAARKKITISNSLAPAYLTKLWFHNTPTIWFWWGWTRAQSYNSWICWVWSFRDHAIINVNWFINMQDYESFSPRWEPNPEFYTYTWPYAAWPSYVYWWHSNY